MCVVYLWISECVCFVICAQTRWNWRIKYKIEGLSNKFDQVSFSHSRGLIKLSMNVWNLRFAVNKLLLRRHNAYASDISCIFIRTICIISSVFYIFTGCIYIIICSVSYFCNYTAGASLVNQRIYYTDHIIIYHNISISGKT